MKKIIFALCMFAVFTTYGQYDTLPYNIGVPNYYMSHPFDSMHVTQFDNPSRFRFPIINSLPDHIAWGDRFCLWHLPSRMPYEPEGDLAFGFYPDSTLHIIGLAWFDGMPWVVDTTTHISYYSYINWDTVDIKIFVPSGPQYMMPIVRKKIAKDTMTFSKILDNTRGWSQGDFTQWIRIFPAAPFLEVFFDNETDISDSFYVSVKYKLKDERYAIYNHDMTPGWMEIYNTYSDTLYNDDVYDFPIQSYRKKDTPGEDDPWTYGEIQAYPLLFPIIRLDGDTCPEVQNVHFIRAGSSAAIAMWDEVANHRDWQFYIGPQGALPNEEEAVTENLPRHLLNGLSPTAHYDVYVRARCRFVRGDEWSSWTGPIDLCMSTIGIDCVDDVEWSLTPNPAHGSVTVQCDEGIMEVEIISMKGESLRHHNAAGAQSCAIDLTGLNKGIYIVQITTPQGTAARKLAVE